MNCYLLSVCAEHWYRIGFLFAPARTGFNFSSFAGMNFIKVIDAGIFDKSPGLTNVDLTFNKCINFNYHERAWKNSKHILYLKCQRADGIERIDLKMFNKPCANTNSDDKPIFYPAGIITGGTPGQL